LEKTQLKKGSISPIPIEKIEKLGVKVFLLTRRVPLRYLWASIWLENVDHDGERVFHWFEFLILGCYFGFPGLINCFFFFWIFRGVSIFNSWRLTIQIIKLLTWKIKTQLNIELAIKKFQLTKVKIGWKWISRQKKLPRFSNYLYSSQIPDKYATCCLPLKKKKAQAPSLGFLFFYFKVCTPHLTFYYYYYLFICSFFLWVYIYIYNMILPHKVRVDDLSPLT